jgi:HK97 gp10 family phage protein
MGIDTSGLRSLKVDLGRTATGQVGAKVAAVVRKTAHDIEATAKVLAPVDTGNLRGSISTTITGDGRFGSISAEIGPTASYGIFVETGTSRMGPQPYMNPAADRHGPQMDAAILAIIGQVLP